MTTAIPTMVPLVIENPYLDIFLRYMQPEGGMPGWWEAKTDWKYSDGYDGAKWEQHMADTVNAYCARQQLVRYCAWAVPNREAIQAIAELNVPVLEIGAGLGYWGWLLNQAGVETALYDNAVGEATTWIEGDAEPWAEVQQGDEGVLLDNDGWPDHALFLCWPPLHELMAERCLKRFNGEWFIYVGEHMGGCCARDEFFGMLPEEGQTHNGWRLERQVGIPCWSSIRDYMTIYRRTR